MFEDLSPQETVELGAKLRSAFVQFTSEWRIMRQTPAAVLATYGLPADGASWWLGAADEMTELRDDVVAPWRARKVV